MNEAVVLALISTAGGVAIAYLAYKGKQGIDKRNKEKQPKDRMETIFDGYEGFIARQDKALENKDKQLAENQLIINRMQKQIDEMQALIERQREETDREREINKRLHEELERMRDQYTNSNNGANNGKK
jgi:Skp family chaperone for outer membrane proteins